MGSLLKDTPHSETNATLELFDRWGVTREGLKRLRRASSFEQQTIAQMIERGILPDQSQNQILEHIGTVIVPALNAKFFAKERFLVSTKRDEKLLIGYIDHRFSEWFLRGFGKTENPTGRRVLCYGRLSEETTVVSDIVSKLIRESKSETTLWEMFFLMRKQGRGQDGALLNDGRANIFLTQDLSSVVRAVYVYWSGHSWDIFGYSTLHPGLDFKGYQIFTQKQ